MSKAPRDPFIGAVVQVVQIVEGVDCVFPAMVMFVHSRGVAVRMFKFVQDSIDIECVASESEVRAHNAGGVGFKADRYWRWPR